MALVYFAPLRRPGRPDHPEDAPLLQVLGQVVVVEEGLRREAGAPPLDLVREVGHPQRAVPDPPHRRAGARVRGHHEQRPEAGLHRAGHHLRFNHERGLQVSSKHALCLMYFLASNNLS